MNTYFQTLLQPEKKRKRIETKQTTSNFLIPIVETCTSFFLFSGRFKAERRKASIYDRFTLRILDCELYLDDNYFSPWYFNPDVNAGQRIKCMSSKKDLNLQIMEYNFRGKNIFLRFNKKLVYNLRSILDRS